jgi:hypothetical protein
MLIAAWAAVVLRGLERTALAARKGRKWERAYLVGLSVGSAFGVGIVLSIKNSLPGFLSAAGSGFAIWAFGRRGAEGKAWSAWRIDRPRLDHEQFERPSTAKTSPVTRLTAVADYLTLRTEFFAGQRRR